MELKPKKSAKESVEAAKLEAEKAELLNDLQRTRADFENFRKQVEIQKEQAKKIATYSTVMKILPLIDDMSRAIKANPETLSPVAKTLEKIMKDLNLAKIDTNEGTEFNPDLHNAISVEESEGEKEVIAEELMPGYLYNGEVLRAAMVRVKRV
jgi:molecular chaperone GrpE